MSSASAPITQLLQQNSTDPRVRLQLGAQLIDLFAVQGYRVPSDVTLIQDLLDMLIVWLNSSNFKVGLLALEVIDAALDVSGDVLAPYMLEHASVFMERLGDSREPVRQSATELLIRLAHVQHSSPQLVLERITLGGLSHKQWLVRIGVMQVAVKIVRTVGSAKLNLTNFVQLVCKLVTDANSQVRDAAVDTLTQLYSCMGDELSTDIKRRRLLAEPRLTGVMQKFDQIAESGQVHDDGMPCEQWMDVGAQRAAKRPPIPSASTSNSVKHTSPASMTTSAYTSPSFRVPHAVSTPRVKSKMTTNTDEVDNAAANRLASLARASSVPANKRINVTSKYSGSAGGVSEDQFEQSFFNVPKLDIFSSKELLNNMQQIRETLSDTNIDWDRRVDALKKLRSVLNGGANNFAEFVAELKLLELPLQLAVKDLRSQVVREACITIALYAERLEMKMERIVDGVFPVLINLIQNSAKVMSTSGLLACRYIIRYVRTAKLIPLVTSYTMSKSREIRRTSCDFVAMIISQWEHHVLEKNMALLVDAIKQGLNDADPDARAASRKAYHALADQYKEHADLLFQSLDVGKQRQLAGQLSHSSSTHSIPSNNDNHNGVNIPRSSGYGSQRANAYLYSAGRSASEIDTGAVRRAIQRNPALNRPARSPQQQQAINSIQRPQRLAVAGGVGTISRRAPEPNIVRNTTVVTPSKSASQPSSRSNSPTSRLPMSIRKPRVSISGRSDNGSREQSPTRGVARTAGYHLSSAYGGAGTLDIMQVHDRLRETSAQINEYVYGNVINVNNGHSQHHQQQQQKTSGGSQDSGIVDAVDSFTMRMENTARLMDTLSLSTDEDRQQEIISGICQELSNHNRRSNERLKCLNTLKLMSRDGSFTLWEEHFKTILLLLIETLGDRDVDIRAQALRVLKEVCLCQASRFRHYAELTVLRVLEAHRDVEKEVVRAAEDCAAILATHLPPHVCLRVLNPVINNEPIPKLLAAIKMMTKVIEQLSPDEIERILPDVVPGIVAAYENEDSSVRKSSVLCLVALQNSIGEDPLQPYLSSLNNSKIKLLQLYVKKAQTSSGQI